MWTNIVETEGMKTLTNQLEKWKQLSLNIKKKAFNDPIIIPDMIWITPNGIGKTVMLEYMAEQLEKMNNIMDFYGDVRFFEFYFEYCKPDAPFSEMERLVNEVESAAGFRNEYHGIIHIDISEWMHNTEDKYFKTFLEYLSDNSDNWLIVISMPEVEKECVSRATAIISSYLRIETLAFSLPDTEGLLKIVKDYLNSYGLKLDKAASAVLADSIDTLKNNKYFDGYKTISMLCKDIVYHVFSASEVSEHEISEDTMHYFKSDGEYISKMIYNDNQRNINKLGF